jgi:prephenate dehydrogenase
MLKIGIIGTGLIGGSLALALNSKRIYEVSCWNRKIETSAKALSLKAVSKYYDKLEDLAGESDVIFLCTPHKTYVPLIEQMQPHFKEHVIISDVGSTKDKITQEVQKILKDKSIFIPSHPIAGKEIGGLENAEGDLFYFKRTMITPTKFNLDEDLQKIFRIWKNVGSRVEYMHIEEHDLIYAYVSHFPQYLSFKLKEMYEGSENPNLKEFMRLMKSPENLWDDIFHYNKENFELIRERFTRKFTDLIKSEKIAEIEMEPLEELSILISKFYMQIVPEGYTKYDGAGFKSFTEPARRNNDFDIIKISPRAKQLAEQLIEELN